eukprot:TRINITY_DN4323_c0_g2_i1.p1 TRINITY_DN4323_c0_g2~~TRINITY_DN4323_c0_g2_i1.p1  ORF type:complete len:192 (-),score=58.53 TRINITY_DN4323_c0_g2_i1:306-815(-)
MEKGSAPPMEEDQRQQAPGMPDMPPSYEESNRSAGAGGFAGPPPPGPSAMYPPLPPDQNKGMPAAQQAQAQMPPPGQQQAPVVTQVQYLPQPNFGFRPINMVCPHCQHNITTSTDGEPSVMAWVIGGVLCALQFYCCMCIPCCIDSLQTVTHKCPNCDKFLGRYRGGGL